MPLQDMAETLALIGATLNELERQLPAIAPALRDAVAEIAATVTALPPDAPDTDDRVARCATDVLRSVTAAALAGVTDGHTAGVMRLQGALDGLAVLLELRHGARTA